MIAEEKKRVVSEEMLEEIIEKEFKVQGKIQGTNNDEKVAEIIMKWNEEKEMIIKKYALKTCSGSNSCFDQVYRELSRRAFPCRGLLKG